MDGKIRKRLQISILTVFFLVPRLPLSLPAEALSVKEFGYSLDLPEGWEPYDASDPARLSFTDPATGAMLQVSTFAREPSLTAERMGKQIGAELKAKGEGEAFSFSGRDAYLSDIEFTSSGRAFQGFVLVVKGLDTGTVGAAGAAPTMDCLLVVFAPAERIEKTQDELFSALDSFSPDDAGKLLPGPISQFLTPFPSGNCETVRLPFLDATLKADIGADGRDTAQVLVEREARLLASYKTGQVAAWNRFYRMIYRDCYHRLDGIAGALRSEIESRGVSSKEIPPALLAWIQGFTYERTGTLADFLSPISAAATLIGDCDSRALLYVTLLHHFGFDAIVLVSSRYSHSLAGVGLDREGAAITFNGRRYLVAETTESVDIGLIAKDMADASGWIPMDVRE